MNMEEERPSQQPHCNNHLFCSATALSVVVQRSPSMTCSVRLTGRWELRRCTQNVGCCCSLTPALPKYRASRAVDSRAAAGVLHATALFVLNRQ